MGEDDFRRESPSTNSADAPTSTQQTVESRSVRRLPKKEKEEVKAKGKKVNKKIEVIKQSEGSIEELTEEERAESEEKVGDESEVAAEAQDGRIVSKEEDPSKDFFNSLERGKISVFEKDLTPEKLCERISLLDEIGTKIIAEFEGRWKASE